MAAPTSYNYVCRAFWADHVDGAPLSEEELIDMSDDLDAMAQDAVSFWIQHKEAPWLTDEEDERLIAAAPDLLEACKLLVALEDNNVHDADTRWKTARNLMRDAINKAENHT